MADDAPRTCPTTAPVIRTIAMPADTNPEGDIFGGWLMSHMDLAGATLAFSNNVNYLTPEALVLNGSGLGGMGAMASYGTNFFFGSISNASASTR